MQYKARVLAVSSGFWDPIQKKRRNFGGLKPGDIVLIGGAPRFSHEEGGAEFEWEGRQLLILKEQEILGVCDRE